MNTSSVRNSSAENGITAVDLGRKDEFTCRCCNRIFIDAHCHEWHDGNWLCPECTPLLEVMRSAGQVRCTQALTFLNTPREIRTGWFD